MMPPCMMKHRMLTVLGMTALGALSSLALPVQAQPQVGPDQLVKTYLAGNHRICPTNCYSC